MSQESPLEFPCRFSIKAMTRASGAGESDPAVQAVVQAVEQHAGPVETASVSVRDSARGNYRAVTVVIQAESREQLDAIYHELTAMETVLMAL